MWQRIRDWFFHFPARLDRRLRWWDFRVNRIEGTSLHEAGFVRGHSRLSFVLPIPVLIVLAYGMLRWRGVGLALACVAALGVHLALARWARGRWLPRLQWLFLAGFAVTVFLVVPETALEADGVPYRHIYGLLGAFALTVGMPAGRWLSERLIGGERERFRRTFAPHLAATQLLVTPSEGPHSVARVVRAYALVPLSSPILFLWIPAFFSLLAPARWLGWIAASTLVLGWIALAATHYNDRLVTFRMLARQALATGAPLLVSLLVIVFAATRLAGVDYVTTVLDQASQRVIWSLFAILYLILWLYDYWLQRAAAETLLGFLRPEAGGKDADSGGTTASADGAPADGSSGDYLSSLDFTRDGARSVRLQIHGAGRWLAIQPPREGEDVAFESYRPLEAFERIHRQLGCDVRSAEHAKRKDGTVVERAGRPLDWATYDDVTFALAALEAKVRLFVTVPALVLLLVLGGCGWWLFHLDQAVSLQADADPAPTVETTGFDLAARLSESAAGTSDEPLLAVAYSGGGTRAALYAYSMMRGLHERDRLGDVVLTSSVSGGSAGVAYFAAHHRALLDAPVGDDSWSRFRDAVGAPFIHDVLAGVGEFRFFQGTRLGALLDEGFGRVYFDQPPACRTVGCPDGDGLNFGVLFNTSITGAREPGEATEACLESGLPPRRCATLARTGGRLAITNIASFTAEAAATLVPGWDHDFDYVTVHDPTVPLTTAAALSANFPPVFSNARVELEAETPSTFYVTDGGAIENRGAISLLLALRAELDALERKPGELQLPPLTVLVAQASGLSTRYSEDRGLGAVGAARRRLGDGLIAELAADLQCRWYRHGGNTLQLVDVPLPDALRTGFGTHWQLPKSIEVRDPQRWFDPGSPAIALDGDDLLDLSDRLFERRRPAPAEGQEGLWEWLTVGGLDPADLLDAALERPAPELPDLCRPRF